MNLSLIQFVVGMPLHLGQKRVGLISGLGYSDIGLCLVLDTGKGDYYLPVASIAHASIDQFSNINVRLGR